MTQQEQPEIMPDLSKPNSPLAYLRLFLSGFAMGASDIVPGVSGGTMAFILGIYETLIDAIKSFNLEAAMKVWQLVKPAEQKPQVTLMDVVDYVHLRFLIPLGLGILTAIFLLSSLLKHWLQTQPTYVFSFFAGLIVASVLAIGLKVKWSLTAVIVLVIGTLLAYFITNPELGTLGHMFGHGPLTLFVSGAVAICAMILPGISGSFILLVLGQYDFVLGAVHERDIVSLFFVAAGAGIGILAFSRILSWLLKHYENPTIALLVGFMVGSMRLILFRITHLAAEGGGTPLELNSAQLAVATSLAIVGFLLVSLIDHLQTRSNPVFSLLGLGSSTVAATES